MSTSSQFSELTIDQLAVGSSLAAARGSALLCHEENEQFLELLNRSFGQAFSLVDVAGAEMRFAPNDALQFDLTAYQALIESVAERGRPEIIVDESPLALLVIPQPNPREATKTVAVSAFVTDQVVRVADVARAASAFGLDPSMVMTWASQQKAWPSQAIETCASAIVDNLAMTAKVKKLQSQATENSTQLLRTFEEITLLHRLTQHLSLSGGVDELCQMAATWLLDVISAECIAIKLVLNGDDHTVQPEDDFESLLITHGNSPLANAEFDEFIGSLGDHAKSETIVLNRSATRATDWRFPQIRELVSVPIRGGDKFFGWMIAVNHTEGWTAKVSESEFGTVEASLMSSVAVILGIHSGNIELYREQSDIFQSMVRAFSSAIDAKDPYTCGHSERVARLSVCLARQMDCSTEELNTLYLSGLLHDIGKIGIDTSVLRKPGALTAEEYEHIKTHPELGYQILKGIKLLDKALPVVLHHHEAWDGHGYPHGLQGEECPKLARIAAVADSIDAMGSDRPYRKGMPDEQLDKILREGAGAQWDADVIKAVFEVRDEIREIGKIDRERLSLDVEQWQTA